MRGGHERKEGGHNDMDTMHVGILMKICIYRFNFFLGVGSNALH
jgi:hypothetical protein